MIYTKGGDSMIMVSFRTDEAVKEQAAKVFESLGMNLTTALNMFLRQAVIQQKFPCSLDLNVTAGMKDSYAPGFFELFGKGAGLGFDEEPKDLPPEDITL